MGFAQKGFTDEPGLATGGRGLDGGTQSRATRANDQHVVFEGLVTIAQFILLKLFIYREGVHKGREKLQKTLSEQSLYSTAFVSSLVKTT
jgi:hypothetical protein